LNSINPDKADTLTRTRYYLERGRLYNSNNEKGKALPEFFKAYEISNENSLDYFAVDALHMIAIAYSNPDDQIQWNEKAIEYAEKSSDAKTKKWLGSLYNNTGWSLFDQGKYTEALHYFDNALDYRELQKEPQSIRIAKWCIARTHRELENYEQALKIQLALEQEYIEQGIEIDGYTLEELAEIYYYMNQNARAKDYFSKAYEKLSTDIWLQRNEKSRLQRLKRLAEE
jgi:tetratricopeptide (TPR) repeat protein